ncbi:FecCD family ABC transporter permease [Candidatus Margulisiibacteriota bacterium]
MKKIIVISLLILVFAFVVYLSLFIGSVPFSPERKAMWLTIFWQIRLPRMVLAMLAGATLALGGVIYQALLKNPLAEPYLLGVSSGAAFGAVLFVILGFAFIPAGAFLGALGAFFLILTLARLSGKISTFSLILSGVVMNAFFAALISMLISFFPRRTFGILFWLMGNLEVADQKMLLVFLVLFLMITALLMFFHRKLDILALGDTEAYHLGIDVPRLKILLFLLTTLLVALAVSLTGVIGFVGLIVPHFARMLVGAKHIKVIPMSLFLGAFFLMAGNVLIYSILKNPDLPIGVITALIGIPFLFYVFLRNKITSN